MASPRHNFTKWCLVTIIQQHWDAASRHPTKSPCLKFGNAFGTYKRWVTKILGLFFRESLSVYRYGPNFPSGHSGIMWTFWLLNVVVAFKTTGFDWKMKPVPKFDVWKWYPVRCWATNKWINITSTINHWRLPCTTCDSPLSSQRVENPFTHFLIKWRCSITLKDFSTCKGCLEIFRICQEISKNKTPVYRDEFESPSWWAQLFSIEMFLFPTPISSPMFLRRRFERSARTRHSSLSARSRTWVFWLRYSVYDSWYPKQSFVSWMFGDFQPLSM